MPKPAELLPHQDSSQLAEMQNHIIASYWVSEAVLVNPGTSGLSEDDRKVPIGVRSNPLCIFSYPVEVLTLMKEFFTWRDIAHNRKLLHPLILACQIAAYFFFIHPFPDGNGRVGRTSMQDYLIRQRYCPVAMQDLRPEEYVQMISDAQDGQSGALVARVLLTHLNMMRTFYSRDMEMGFNVFATDSC